MYHKKITYAINLLVKVGCLQEARVICTIELELWCERVYGSSHVATKHLKSGMDIFF